ncbi:MAG: RecX family transcriptional regulator [Candidatus Aminicenantes bacterium]|nr:RecX family transcriptional regulator [Candidatus Aminicenantes bacterium]
MEFTVEQQRAYDRAAALCARVETCAADLLKKLKAWKLTHDEAVAVTDRLESDGFLDDERFASAYVKDKFRFNGWGKRKIMYMLRSKRIAPDILERALAEIEDGAFAEKLRKLLLEKARRFKDQDPFRKRGRLIRFALSRGFDLDEVNAMLAELEL